MDLVDERDAKLSPRCLVHKRIRAGVIELQAEHPAVELLRSVQVTDPDETDLLGVIQHRLVASPPRSDVRSSTACPCATLRIGGTRALPRHGVPTNGPAESARHGLDLGADVGHR